MKIIYESKNYSKARALESSAYVRYDGKNFVYIEVHHGQDILQAHVKESQITPAAANAARNMQTRAPSYVPCNKIKAV